MNMANNNQSNAWKPSTHKILIFLSFPCNFNHHFMVHMSDIYLYIYIYYTTIFFINLFFSFRHSSPTHSMCVSSKSTRKKRCFFSFILRTITYFNSQDRIWCEYCANFYFRLSRRNIFLSFSIRMEEKWCTWGEWKQEEQP